MSSNEIANKKHALLFSVRRSIRYHYRRVRFFDKSHKIGTFLAAMSGTGTLTAVLAKSGPEVTLSFAVLVTIFSVFNLVIGPSQKARQHNDFAKRYFLLEKEILKFNDISTDDLRTLIAVRLDIEADEPPPYKILDAMCHNELARAEGYSPSYCVKIAWYQRLLANFCDFREHAMKPPVYDKCSD